VETAEVNAVDGLRVLVVEDEVLLALALEDDLVSAGCTVIGPFRTLASATEACRRERFDLATLDVNLGGELVYPLADELVARRMPFVLITGYGSADLPERFRTLPRLTKPYDPVVLIREIRRAMARPA
jgi:DNA-binding NtrC family response regulator